MPGTPTSRKNNVSLSSVRHVVKTLVWPRRGILSLGLALIVINRLSGLVLPGSTKFLIDSVIGEGNTGMLKWLLAAVGGALFVQATTSFALTRLLSVEAHRLIAELRTQVQRKVIRLPLRFFDENKSGALVSRIMSDVEGVRNLVGTGLVQLVGGILTAIVAVFLLIRINPQMTLLAFIPLAIFGLISMQAFKFLRPIFRKRREINAEVTGRLTESLGGIRVIKGFHAEGREIAVFERGADRLFQNVSKTLTASSLITSAATLLMGLASVIIMGLGATLIVRGEMTVGDFFAFTLYLAFLVAPIVQMSNIGTQITEAFAGLDRMEELFAMEDEGAEASRTVVLDGIVGSIGFEGVCFAYAGGENVLEDITFTAAAGSVTALVGSSGAGKTTLAGLAASFLTPSAGTITVDGLDLSTVTLDSYRSRLGVVLQDDFLFEGTIGDNILFGNPSATSEQVQAAVAAAHVKEFTDRFPVGLDTVIGERGVKLSGGQRQRVTIARAILADPRILILDEATSSLDTESESYIQRSLARLMEGRTTFVIAHRLSTIRKADQIFVMEKGRIVERGSHESLLGARGRYFELYTYQARI